MIASVFAVFAALCFAAGGLFMKLSAGVTRLWSSIAFLLLFGVGAIFQGLAMRNHEMGAVYIAVLGIEAVFALGFSVFLVGENFSAVRIGAVLLILAGVALLRQP